MRIYCFLMSILILSSCSNRVFVNEPIPFTTDKTPLKTVPDYLCNTFIKSSCNIESAFISEVDSISIEQVGNMLFLDFEGWGLFVCDFSTNTIAVKEGNALVSDVHGEEFRAYEMNSKVFLNVNRSSSWEFVIIEPMEGDRIRVVTSEYNREQFEAYRFIYESNKNFVSMDEDNGHIQFRNVDAKQFEHILNDRYLLNSCIFTKR